MSAAILCACGSGDTNAGGDAGEPVDGATADGPGPDTTMPVDSGTREATGPDSTMPVDSGTPEAPGPDTSMSDSSASDASDAGDAADTACSASSGDASIVEYPVANALDGGLQVLRIARGSDGNMWLPAAYDPAIVRITPAGAITRFAVPGAEAYPAGVALGPDGKIWFTDVGTGSIGRVDVDGGVTELPLLPEADGGLPAPAEITAGPDGNLWVTLPYDDAVDRVSTTGQDTRFPVGLDAGALAPSVITAGPDGNLWFAAAYAPFVSRISTDGVVTHVPVSGASFGIGVGPDGAVWFTMRGTIGRIAPGPTLAEQEFSVPGFGPAAIMAGPDCDRLYVADNLANQIRSFTAPAADAGPDAQLAFTNYDLPTPTSNPESLALGAAGSVWFVEYAAQNVGVLQP